MSTNGWNAGDWTTAERGDKSTATRRPDHWADCSPSVDDGWRQDPWADDHWRPNGQGDGAASEHGRLIEEFLTGEAGRDVASEQDHEWLLEAVLRFAREHGYDPMVLTPVAVEVLLLDWVARELRDDGHYLLKLPGVLGDFVAYGHRRNGVPPAETIATLIAVSRSTTAYWEMLDAWRFQRSADRFGTFGVPYRRRRQEEHPLQTLATEVGGLRRLEELDTEALPDEPFELDGVPEDIRPRVDRVRELAESCCAALLDVDGGIEHRTAVRRLLHDVASGDPRIFRRPSRDDTAAAALCLLVGKANAAVVVDYQSLNAHFGLPSTPSSRAYSMRRAAGLPECGRGIGSTRYLTSTARRRIIERRDRVRRGV